MQEGRTASSPSSAVLDAERLADLQATGLLDAGAQPALERFTRLACAIVDALVALVSLVDDSRQYFPAMQGLTGWAADARATPLSHSFCQHVVSDGTLEVPDALAHPVLRDNLAVPDLGVRAYLGIPVVSATGRRMGALCAIDGKVRKWTTEQRQRLEDLAAAVSADLQLRLAAAASRHSARHDALTGLGNRREFERDIELAFGDRAGEPVQLAVLDLDGFKSYNDAFGHPAGDDLLRRIAGRLRQHSEIAGGTAYRMGGDEFCLLMPAAADVSLIAEAIAERTGPYEITASFGAVTVETEVTTAAEAMRLADERLYSRKHLRPTGGAQQACAALLQALAERHPTLCPQPDALTELAQATARQLELEEGHLIDVSLTARLRDIGKVSIPDSILDKPAGLDEDEWAFIRRHTIVGERILSAVPALRHIATAVRATHERWDGTGYPDGLSGCDIPPAARIVFAVDSYVAMVADRPYRGSLHHDDAIRELRAGAGTQFDPAVVAALERTLSGEVLDSGAAMPAAPVPHRRESVPVAQPPQRLVAIHCCRRGGPSGGGSSAAQPVAGPQGGQAAALARARRHVPLRRGARSRDTGRRRRGSGRRDGAGRVGRGGAGGRHPARRPGAAHAGPVSQLHHGGRRGPHECRRARVR